MQRKNLPDNCDLCGGKLVFINSPKLYWNIATKPPRWTLAESGDEARKKHAKNGPPIKQGQCRMVACGACGTPVEPDHPLQVKMDADWAARDKADKEEAIRQSKQPKARLAVQQANPLLAISEAQERLEQENAELRQRLAKLEEKRPVLQETAK
jgi:hypothetical protein